MLLSRFACWWSRGAVAATVFFVHASLAPPVQALSPRDYLDEQRLAAELWQRSAEVLESRQSVGAAAAENLRAHILPNPALDLAWATIPVGKTTPSDLHEPLSHVPNYTAGLSELIEIGKRGPRQRATAAELGSAEERSLATLGDQFFELLDTIGHMAAAQERITVLNDLVGASDQLLEIDRARVDKGDLAEVDYRRSEVEHMKMLVDRDQAQGELSVAEATCARLVGQPCPEFATGQEALNFLDLARDYDLPRQWSDEIEKRRPDLQALELAARGAEERATLARRAALPDVTVRLGYTYDSFVSAGNQRNSLALGVQMPLPVADHGQADLLEALSARDRTREARAGLIAAAQASLSDTLRRRDVALERRRRIDKAVEKARSVYETLEGAERKGAASLADVLLAQRAYREVLLQRADLDAELFDATVDARRIAAIFPKPVDLAEGMK